MIEIRDDDGQVVETITAAEHLAGIVEGRAETSMSGTSKVISVRLHTLLFLDLQALTHKSGKTRNYMIERLLEVGLEEVRKSLSTKTLSDLNELHQEKISDLDEETEEC
jgi:predicted DNA-binding protein